MKDGAVFKKNTNFVSRVIDKEMILMPLYKTSHEINAIYTLNPAAAKVWEMFDGKKSLADIRKHILKDFDTVPDEVDRGLNNLIKDLKEMKAIA